MKRTRRTRLFYKSLSLRSRVTLDAAIFCLFAPVGVAVGMLLPSDRGWLALGALVVLSGGSAVMYGRAGFTGRYTIYLPAGVIMQAALLWLPRVILSESPAPESRRIEVMLLIGFIAAGYALFLSVFQREGAQYFSRGAEIRLAQRMHDRLVPAVSGRVAGIEWEGVSRPSGEIGGDLVDVVEGPAGLVGCVADVSGHGVGAGLLMGMFKTAFRTSVGRLSDPAELLAEIHATLAPLTEPNMYATAGVLRVSPGSLQFAGGGHPPLLLYRAATARVEEVPSTGPAIALLDDFSCTTVDVPFARGDIALLLTDGILEAFDAAAREVGIEPVSRMLAAHASAPLPDLLARVTALATAGTRLDDQTVLIVRAV